MPFFTQPPSGGCVLKPHGFFIDAGTHDQPPSGGCVLKQPITRRFPHFRAQPPSGGCVLKPFRPLAFRRQASSRLRAAVC